MIPLSSVKGFQIPTPGHEFHWSVHYNCLGTLLQLIMVVTKMDEKLLINTHKPNQIVLIDFLSRKYGIHFAISGSENLEFNKT